MHLTSHTVTRWCSNFSPSVACQQVVLQSGFEGCWPADWQVLAHCGFGGCWLRTSKLWLRAVWGDVDLLIGKFWLRAVLGGVDLLIGKLSLRAVLKTGAAPTKKCARTTNVGHSLCPKNASRTWGFWCCSVRLLSRRFGAGKQVGGQSGFGRCRAARGFYYKFVVGTLLGAGKGPMKSAPEPGHEYSPFFVFLSASFWTRIFDIICIQTNKCSRTPIVYTPVSVMLHNTLLKRSLNVCL